MSNEPTGYSKGGQPIYKHEREKGFQPPEDSNVFMEEITSHFEKHVGEVSSTFHELISDQVHIDIHLIPPSEKRDFYTLFTTGMSDQEMKVPQGAEDYRLGELMICLPKDWKLSYEDFNDEKNYWPMRWLKILVRLPHEYDTWLGFGHTIPNGDPARPFVNNTGLCGMMLSFPLLVDDPQEFYRLKLTDGRMINFYSVLPLYKEEMDFKLKNGAEALLDKFDENGITELLDINRKNVCKKGFSFFK